MTTARMILVATDLSAPARHAVHRALLLASSAGSEVHIVHALELDALDSLRELLGANFSATRATLEADACERLAQLATDAADYDADLIVVGKHGTHITEELPLGSVTKHVLAEAQCGVQVVADPRAAEDRSP